MPQALRGRAAPEAAQAPFPRLRRRRRSSRRGRQSLKSAGVPLDSRPAATASVLVLHACASHRRGAVKATLRTWLTFALWGLGTRDRLVMDAATFRSR